MKDTKKKTLPEFAGEHEEQEFWRIADSTNYVDWQAAKRVRLTKLKPSLRTISLRLPVAMLEELKLIANKRDVPYQSLLKVFLAERLSEERKPVGKRRKIA
jgi:predicted DNA binding CopG/RHH family protein